MARLATSAQSRLVAEQVSWIRDRNAHCDLVGKDAVAIEVLAPSKPCMVSAIQQRIAILTQAEDAALDADTMAGRAAEEVGTAALRKALAAGKTIDPAWDEAALAAGRAALDVELAAGRPQEVARRAAQQAENQVHARAPKARAGNQTRSPLKCLLP
jgi:hypothetical protein